MKYDCLSPYNLEKLSDSSSKMKYSQKPRIGEKPMYRPLVWKELHTRTHTHAHTHTHTLYTHMSVHGTWGRAGWVVLRLDGQVPCHPNYPSLTTHTHAHTHTRTHTHSHTHTHTRTHTHTHVHTHTHTHTRMRACVCVYVCECVCVCVCACVCECVCEFV